MAQPYSHVRPFKAVSVSCKIGLNCYRLGSQLSMEIHFHCEVKIVFGNTFSMREGNAGSTLEDPFLLQRNPTTPLRLRLSSLARRPEIPTTDRVPSGG